MSIPESTFSRWSHHQAATAFKQAHGPIRNAMEEHKGLSQFTYEVFLQGSYKNDTNLGGDSDVDVVIRLAVSERRVRKLARDGRLRGAVKAGAEWLIPTPVDVTPSKRGPVGVAGRADSVTG